MNRYWGVAVVTLAMRSAVETSAQQRPLVTEDPETVGAGRILVEAGTDYGRDVRFPVSGLSGHLTRVPVGVSFGVGSIAELQVDGGLWSRLAISDRRPGPLSDLVAAAGATTSSVGDLVVGTKVRVVPEGGARPGVGFRIATKLPRASIESGLGQGTMDFHATLLVAKTMESVRVVGNVGLGTLGDPTLGTRRNDVLVYGVSFARALSEATEVVGEIHGQAARGEVPATSESRGTLRFGARHTVGMLRLDAALVLGLTAIDAGVGLTAGLTYVFNAFSVP